MNFLTANAVPEDISAYNPFKDAGQGSADHFYNNLSFSPTVEELNQKMGSSPKMVRPSNCAEAQPQNDPLFGSHLREAAVSVKKLFR